ncbi:MAG TPA: siphovirus ReqiPepy6 Gp37-like family protein [Candidatus Limnocylindrales bacterium]|nr:siphovirus ReqiPepy6 Gp37-like family protein [Candidatus Limnocylindrales bacterium]
MVGGVYLLDETRAVVGRLDPSYATLSTVRRFWGIDSFSLEIDRRRLYASDIALGRWIFLPASGELYAVELVDATREGSGRAMSVMGRSIEGAALAERRVVPPVGEAHDRVVAVSAETAMKHYVAANAGPSAAAARQIPGLALAADTLRGPTITTQGRYQALAELLSQIGMIAGLGWSTTYDRASDTITFDVVEGVDRSAAVFLDFAFETLESWERLDDATDSKTLAIVAGQGEGAERDVVLRWSGAEPTGLTRREAFVDARDVDLGNTALLEQRGDAFLAAARAERRIEAVMHQHGSFGYGRDFDLGDLVLVRSDGTSFVSRVVEVTSKWSRSVETPEITLALDRPFATLGERVASASAGSSAPIVDTGTGGGGGTPGTGTTTSAVGDATSHGTSSDYSRTDHRHGREASGSPVASAVGDTGVAGSATTIARSDHRHAREGFGNPVASAVGDTQGAGSAASVARSDHRHAREAFGAVQAQTSFGAASADGTAATVARSDHRHGTPANPKLGVMFVPAGALLPHLTSGASGPSQIERPTNRQNAVVAEFPDGSQTDATFLTVMPADYNGGTITARFVWLIATGSTQTCRWQLQARGYADAQTLDQAWGTAQAVDDAGTATAYQVLISGSTPAITPGGSPAGGNLMLFRASRLGAHANDTLTQTALLAGVLIEYTRT